MVYALQIQQIEAHVQSERQVTASMVAAGAKGLTWPTVEQAVAEFDAFLVSEVKPQDRKRQQLLEALGVA